MSTRDGWPPCFLFPNEMGPGLPLRRRGAPALVGFEGAKPLAGFGAEPRRFHPSAQSPARGKPRVWHEMLSSIVLVHFVLLMVKFCSSADERPGVARWSGVVSASGRPFSCDARMFPDFRYLLSI